MRRARSGTLRLRGRPWHPERAGFTLVELLVAVLLIDIGLLALVAASALVVRQATESHAHATAVRMAMNRIESSAARFPCAATSGHATGPHGIQEDWSIRLSTSGEREIVDSVRLQTTSGTKLVILQARTPC